MDGTTAASGAAPGGQADTATPICRPTGGAEPAPALGSPRAAPRPEAIAQEAEQSPQPAPRQSSSAGEHRHMPFANTEYRLGSRGDESQRQVQFLTSHLLLAAPAEYGTPKSRPRSRCLRCSLKEKKGGGHGDTVLSSCRLLTLCLRPLTTKTDAPSVGGGGWGTADTGRLADVTPLPLPGCLQLLGPGPWEASPFSYTDGSRSGAAELT